MDSMAGKLPGDSDATRPWWVVCLCAQWCGVCNQYRSTFAELASQFPQMRFVWLDVEDREDVAGDLEDRKSTRLNSSHLVISYAVFCLKKKKNKIFVELQEHRRPAIRTHWPLHVT